jgi:hypothetical protein
MQTEVSERTRPPLSICIKRDGRTDDLTDGRFDFDMLSFGGIKNQKRYKLQ